MAEDGLYPIQGNGGIQKGCGGRVPQPVLESVAPSLLQAGAIRCVP